MKEFSIKLKSISSTAITTVSRLNEMYRFQGKNSCCTSFCSPSIYAVAASSKEMSPVKYRTHFSKNLTLLSVTAHNTNHLNVDVLTPIYVKAS
jgi:hypothetical protein